MRELHGTRTCVHRRDGENVAAFAGRIHGRLDEGDGTLRQQDLPSSVPALARLARADLDLAANAELFALYPGSFNLGRFSC